MKPKDRRAEIAALIGRDGPKSVEALAEHFDVSFETIRRDLALLTEQGAVLKVHGGARPVLQLHAEPSFQERMAEETEGKSVIAELLAEEIRPGSTLFMDTGSTTLFASSELAKVPGIRVVTNSLAIAQTFGRSDGRSQVCLLGGDYVAGNNQTVGHMVLEQIDRFQVDHAVITVAALDTEAGAMDSDPNEAAIARAMIRRAANLIVLATPSKFARRAAFRVCDLDEIDTLICGERPSGEMAAALEGRGVASRWRAA